MSGFICVLERSGERVRRRDLARLAAPLARGGAAVASHCEGAVGIAVVRAGGGGASSGVESAGGRVTAIAGRFRHLETRRRSASPAAADLLSASRPGDPGPLLDASALAGVTGAFALIAADPAAAALEVARDHLGSYKVCYVLDRHRLIVASEAAALLGHPSVSSELDEGSVARFLGFRFGHTEQSFFRQVRELPPAHRLRVTASEVTVDRYWRFGAASRLELGSPEEITGRFLHRLKLAVARETTGLEPRQVALSLSGGLDSPAIAAVAAPGVQAISWTFDDDAEADERPRIEAVARHLGLSVKWVKGDRLYPLGDGFAERFVHRSSPYLNPFAALKHRLYATARECGCTRILVGDAGDAHYAASDFWLRDLLATGRFDALRELANTTRRALRGDRAARGALGRLPLVGHLARAARRPPAPWLTAEARARLPPETPSPIVPPGSRGIQRMEPVVGVRHSELESEERRLFDLCGVERANPFWSWPLLEMSARLPAYWLRRGTRTKVLIREALAGRLPETILESPRQGLLGGFFLRGIEARRDELRETLFRRPVSDWSRYVRREWLLPHLETTTSITLGHTILWRVICYELWCRRLFRE